MCYFMEKIYTFLESEMKLISSQEQRSLNTLENEKRFENG